MRAFHSFSTRPLFRESYNRKVHSQVECVMTLAALSCLQARRVGIELVLHTDELGEKMFGFLPYSNIYRTLDRHKGHDVFWASGKMVAHEHEPLGSVHLDVDAVIKKRGLVEVIEHAKEDLVVEEYEFLPHIYRRLVAGICEEVPQFPHIDMAAYRHNEAFRCGLVKFNNPELKDKYLKGYWKIHDEYIKKTPNALKSKKSTPDLVVEQSYLLNLVLQNNFSHLALFKSIYNKGGLCDEEQIDNGRLCPREVGWNHFLSGTKLFAVPQIKEELRKSKREFFEKLEGKIKEVTGNRSLFWF